MTSQADWEPTPFRFRELREGDLPAVAEIERLVFRNPWPRSAFKAFLRPDVGFAWVAVADSDMDPEDGSRQSREPAADRREEIAGYALGWIVAPEAELANLAVHPRWQRRSLGTALLRRALESCAERGAEDVFLDVRPSNTAARQLYFRHGFREWSRRRNYYRTPREDALILRASLRTIRQGLADVAESDSIA